MLLSFHKFPSSRGRTPAVSPAFPWLLPKFANPQIVAETIENKQNFNDIKQYANVIEQRIDDTWCTKESVLRDNMRSLELCRKYGCNYIFIDKCYEVEVEL